MAHNWTLTVRNGPRVEHVHFDTLGDTLDALERRIDELAPGARRHALQIARRRYEPARQVAVRAEITGRGGPLSRPRGGVDLRGDGSAEAYTGRFRRRLVQLRAGETPYVALRRTLEG
ncbi:MAG TPA: hypothetical protein VK756_04720 [Solirubrobacteraceae bacterium]|jgi:hypothetical protein|nr:hypothetical protein [Solirubrobacteraceae bacterium]